MTIRVGWALGKSSIGLGTPGNPNIGSTYVCLCHGYATGDNEDDTITAPNHEVFF
jgi:hypothetical protein